MINHILIFILLILVVILFIRKENFTTVPVVTTNSDIPPASECNYIPRGRTKGNCLKYCRDPKLKQFYEKEDKACAVSNCIEICNSCSSPELCHWLDPYTPYKEEKEADKRTNELQLSYSVQNGSLILRWKWIKFYQHLSLLKNNYIIVFKEVNTNINNSSILQTHDKFYNFVLDNESTALPLLKRNTEYVFIIYSTDKVRRNGVSNLINVKT